MNNAKIELTIGHIYETLDSNTLIGSDEAKDGLRKRFYYNAFEQVCIVQHGNKEIARGSHKQEMLDIYNEI